MISELRFHFRAHSTYICMLSARNSRSSSALMCFLGFDYSNYILLRSCQTNCRYVRTCLPFFAYLPTCAVCIWLTLGKYRKYDCRVYIRRRRSRLLCAIGKWWWWNRPVAKQVGGMYRNRMKGIKDEQARSLLNRPRDCQWLSPFASRFVRFARCGRIFCSKLVSAQTEHPTQNQRSPPTRLLD